MTIPPIERFLALTRIVEGGCWEWLGSSGTGGYGQFILDGRRDRKKIRIAPYRFIWEYVNGRPMPEGLEPDHTCNVRSCVNPAHIEPVTHAENQRRSYQRGRKRAGVDYIHPHHKPSHCKHGHAYTPANTYINPSGAMVCCECNRIRCAAYQAKRRSP